MLGNRQLRRYFTSSFRCGQIAFGEKNHYAMPMFPFDWIRVDIDGADFDVDLAVRRPLSFADASQRVLYAAHVVGHLDDLSFTHFLQECYRILTLGGAIRIETPDVERLIGTYLQREESLLSHFRDIRRKNLVERHGFPRKYLEDHLTVLGEISSYIDPTIDSGHIPAYAGREQFEEKLRTLNLDEFARWCVSLQTPEQLASGGHRNWMSWHKLDVTLRSAGFERVTRVDFGVTSIPHLLLNRGWRSIREKRHRASYSIYVEAFKGEESTLGTLGT